MHILDKIVLHKTAEVAESKKKKSISILEKSEYFNRNCIPFASTLGSDNQYGFIAEFKRKSPSKKNINLTADLSIVTQGYADAGAGAISILTDEHFFGGHNNFLTETRNLLKSTPLLRKEFIVDEYQIIEAKSIGADIILLIAEILSKEQIEHFSKLARSLDLEVLLELHSQDQLYKYSEHVSMVGVNNRDLSTFEVDYNRSKNLYDSLPSEVPKIAESGLSDIDTVVMLYNYGFNGFLIGEQFMKNENPAEECKKMIDEFKLRL